MTIIETTVTHSINLNGLTMEELEAQIGDALQQAGRDLLIQACQVMEAQVLEEHSELRRSKRRGTAPADPLRLDTAVSLADAGCAGTLLLSP